MKTLFRILIPFFLTLLAGPRMLVAQENPWAIHQSDPMAFGVLNPEDSRDDNPWRIGRPGPVPARLWRLDVAEADALSSIGEFEKARRRLNRVTSKVRDSRRAWMVAVRNEERAGNPELALGLANKALIYLPEDPVLKIMRNRLYKGLQRTPGAWTWPLVRGKGNNRERVRTHRTDVPSAFTTLSAGYTTKNWGLGTVGLNSRHVPNH